MTKGDGPLDGKVPDREYSNFGTFASTTTITLDSADMEIAIDASATASGTHTFTGKARGANSSGSTIAILAANQGVLISGRGIASVTIDGADAGVIFRKGPAGTVHPFSVGSAPAAPSTGHSVVGVGMYNLFGNQTVFAPLDGGQTQNGTTDALVRYPVRFAGTIGKLAVKPTANNYAGGSTVTLFKNGVATALTVSIVAGSVALVEDLVDSVAFVAGDLLSWQQVLGGAGDGAVSASWNIKAEIIA